MENETKSSMNTMEIMKASIKLYGAVQSNKTSSSDKLLHELLTLDETAALDLLNRARTSFQTVRS